MLLVLNDCPLITDPDGLKLPDVVLLALIDPTVGRRPYEEVGRATVDDVAGDAMDIAADSRWGCTPPFEEFVLCWWC